MVCLTRRCTNQYKVCGRPFIKEFSNVGRHALVVRVVIGRLKVGTFIFKHLQ